MVLIKWCVYAKYWYALLKYYFNSKTASRTPLCFFDSVGAKADGGNRPPVTRPNYGCQVTVQVSVVTMNR